MAAAPERAQPNQYVSASFLNYCRDGVAAVNGMDQSIQDNGLHKYRWGDILKCRFQVMSTVDIPAKSVFKITHYHDQPYALAERTANQKSAVYTNRDDDQRAGYPFYPYLVSPYQTFRLSVDTSAGIVAGDFCQPLENEFTVTKGGRSLLCLTDPDTEDCANFLGLPAESATVYVGFVVNANLEAQSAGDLELYNKNNVPTGEVIKVFNPHDVVFLMENTTPGEEHPADRLIAFQAEGWPEPVVYPFMLTECADLIPTFEPEYV